MRKATSTILFSAFLFAAVFAAVLGPHGIIAPAHALAGSEAWCIVTDEGNTHCNYATSQECLAAVASTRGGFCNQNSTGGSAPAAASSGRGRLR